MKKPKFPRAKAPSVLDTCLSERIIRALQDSHLHVCQFLCMASHPKYPGTNRMVTVTLTGVTDGTRGYLLVGEDIAPPETDRHMAEFMDGVYNGEPAGDDFVIALGWSYVCFEPTPGLLPMRQSTRVRPTIEEEYAKAFVGKSPIDHARFVARFTEFNYGYHDERACRTWCADLDQIEPGWAIEELSEPA